MLKQNLNLFLKEVMDKAILSVNALKSFLKTKGFTALFALGLGSVFLLMGYPFLGGIGFGIFFAKNTQIIKELLEDYDLI